MSLEDDNTEIVVTIAVESDRSGHLTLYKQSDTIYLVEYHDQEQVIRVDIDSVHIDVKRQIVRFQEPAEDEDINVFYYIPDRQHLQIFHDAQRECQEICNYTLELLCRLRDVYFAGIYTQLRPGDDIIVSQDLQALQEESRVKFLENMKNRKKTPKKRASLTIEPSNISTELCNGLEENDQLISCFYCDTDGDDVQYVIHPYVPRNIHYQRIYMCTICIENWKFYRDFAISESQLILPGEVNEEICALCSDTPETLVLCHTCIRSYCNACLSKVLTKLQYERMESIDIDWSCMCCLNKLSMKPLLSREAWTIVQNQSKHYKKCHKKMLNKHHASTVKLNESMAIDSEDEIVAFDCSKSSPTSQSKSSQQAQPLSNRVQEVVAKSESIPTIEEVAVSSQTSEDDGHLQPQRPSRTKLPSKRLREAMQLMKGHQQHTKRRKADVSSHGPVASSRVEVNPMRFGNGKPLGRPKAAFTLAAASQQQPAAVVVISPIKKKDYIMRKKQHPSPTASTGASVLHDEVTYFAEYLLYLEDLYSRDGAGGSRREMITEDVCYLCKDGGEVIECDWCWDCKHLASCYPRSHLHPQQQVQVQVQQVSGKVGTAAMNKPPSKIRCLKVYHEACLGYAVNDKVKWHCPRHYCSICGGKASLTYLCTFCPISICADCPQLFAQKVSRSLSYRRRICMDGISLRCYLGLTSRQI
jgi:hypothetical protein